MQIPLTPLSPDDDSQEDITLPGQQALPGQPYLLTAVIGGMFILLVLNGIMRVLFPDVRVSFAVLLNTSIVGGGILYLALINNRPKLPLRLLAVCAAELGMFYSLPSLMVYAFPWSGLLGFSGFLWCVILAGLLASFLSYVFKVEESPSEVLSVCFLSLFAVVSFVFTFIIRL